MDAQLTGRTAARHLSWIQEEPDSREHSACFLPPIVQQQAGRAGEPGVCEADKQEGREAASQQRRLEDSRSLLEELGRIEAELRLDVEQQQETESTHQKKNKQLLQNLQYLNLSQRVAKPWVSSYFRVFPMHIYCLPIQTLRHKGRRLNKRR